MKKYKFLITYFLVLTTCLSAASSQKKILNKLFINLSKTRNIENARHIEEKIWSLWNAHPQSLELTEKLEFGTDLMTRGNYNYALKVFDNIIKNDPKWSEAWNKRATLLFYMEKFQKSLEDIKIVLDIEPRHFGALSGQAQIYINLEKYEKAIESLKKAQEIYPLIQKNEIIFELEELIKKDTI